MIKELRPVGRHMLVEVWEDDLALEVHRFLDSMKVLWTSIDVVRIGDAKDLFKPVVLWIGVKMGSLDGYDGIGVASGCQRLLIERGIVDVEVEIRESEVFCSAGPRLLTPTLSSDPTVNVRQPLTATLGFPICSQSSPLIGGTAGFFVSEGDNHNRLLLVTARHVVFTSRRKSDNIHYQRRSANQPRHDVVLFSFLGFNNYLGLIQGEIGAKVLMEKYFGDRIKAVEGRADEAAKREREKAQAELYEASEAKGELHTFYHSVATHWSTLMSRTLGHVVLSPPVNSEQGYTEDWAVIEVNASKVNAENFRGNVVDLGTHITPSEFTCKMYPNIQNAHSFVYPPDRLLKLQGTISREEMRNPTSLDESGEPCIIVMKRGASTGLTIGRATNIVSYSRKYFSDADPEDSKEWAILPLDSKSGVFSSGGDSGSVIVDGRGHIGGLLTGGAGIIDSVDVTYATPIGFLFDCMAKGGLQNLHVNPVL